MPGAGISGPLDTLLADLISPLHSLLAAAAAAASEGEKAPGKEMGEIGAPD